MMMMKMKSVSAFSTIAFSHFLFSDYAAVRGICLIHSHSAPGHFSGRPSKQVFISGFANEIANLEDGLSLYKEMVRMKPLPYVTHFNQLLGRLVKLKHYPAVISLFKDMCSLRIPSDEFTMNIVINCFCLMNRVDFGLSILGGFFKGGLLPNVTTFGTLVKGLFRADRIPEAQELFKKIIRQNLCEPNIVMYGTVTDGLCKVGSTDIALQFLRVMERGRCKPNCVVYNTIIDSLCKNQMIDEALSLLSEMIEKGISPNVFTYNSLMYGLCILGRWEGVKKLFDEMMQFKIFPDTVTFNILVDALGKDGKIEDAERLIQVMIQRGDNPDVVTYNSLMDGYCLHGRMEEARKVFDIMVASGPAPDVMTYTTMIKGFFVHGLLEEVKEVLLIMEKNGCSLDNITYNMIVQEFLRRGNYYDAQIHFKEMVDRGFQPNAYTSSKILDLIPEKENDPVVLQMIREVSTRK